MPLPALDFDKALVAFAVYISRTPNTAATALAPIPCCLASLTYLARVTRGFHGNLDGEATQVIIETARRQVRLGTCQRCITEKDALRVLEAMVSGRAMGLDEKLGAQTVK